MQNRSDPENKEPGSAHRPEGYPFCPGCARLRAWHESALERGHALGVASNEAVTREAAKTLREARADAARTNVIMTEALTAVEAQRDALFEGLRRLKDWGGFGSQKYSATVAFGVIDWFQAGAKGELPALPDSAQTKSVLIQKG